MINFNFSYKQSFKLFKLLICCLVFNIAYAAESPLPKPMPTLKQQVERPTHYYGVKPLELAKLKPDTIKRLVEAIIRYTQALDGNNFLDDQLYNELDSLRTLLENRAVAPDPLTDAQLISILLERLKQADPENALKSELAQIITDLQSKQEKCALLHAQMTALLEILPQEVDPEDALKNELNQALERLAHNAQTQGTDAPAPRSFFGIINRLFEVTKAKRAARPSPTAQPAVSSNQRRKGRAKKSPAAKTAIPCTPLMTTPRAFPINSNNATHQTQDQSSCHISPRPAVSKLLIAYHALANI